MDMTDISECLGVSCPDDIISADLATRLKDTKTLIDDESVKVKWDIAKRLVNPYELVGLSRIQNENGHFQNVGVSRIRPLSRAFFKFVELSANFNIHMAWDKPVTTLHLAEGPGGFIQAWDYLRLQMGLCDNICGITLIQRENDAVPGWRRSREFLRQHSNIHTLVGETGNGDLTLTANINYLRRHFSGNRPMLVTGDGGFDVSDNFNNQESDMFLLILSQTLCALETLNVGGIFLLKIFDTFTRPMMDLLWVLKGSFKKVLLEKPLTSRPANSEK